MSSADAPEIGRWRLESVSLTDFRGVLGTKQYKFSALPALVYGENGVGKSTLALALEWILFGEFPSQSFGTPRPAFMSPVGSDSKGCKGEVVFARGAEQLVVRRDGEEKTLSVECGGLCRENEEGIALLEETLGLDQDTFVRAVLLQQSKIRGLLLDEPKERNRALDRLLGMEEAEAMLEVIKPKQFKDAAKAWRSLVESLEAAFVSQHEMLGKQYKSAEAQAREYGFLNRELSVAGLQARYSDLSKQIARVGLKYGVEADSLPDAKTVAEATKTSVALEKTLRQIRSGSKVHKKLAPIAQRIANLEAVQRRSAEVETARDEAEKELAQLERRGDLKVIQKRIAALDADIAVREQAVRTASEHWSLLSEARTYLKNSPIKTCPVCEQTIGAPKDFLRGLGARLDALSTGDVQSLKASLDEARAAHESATDTARDLSRAGEVLASCRVELEKERHSAMKVLGVDGVVENRLAAELNAAIGEAEEARASLTQGIEEMEAELATAADKDRAIRDGFIPFLSAREGLAAFEADWNKAKESYKSANDKAAELDELATDVENIRRALLASKEEVVVHTLGTARPRALELYRALVQHPLFDCFEVKTALKAGKVDYLFEVSSSKHAKSAREARLVLSDGQMTATALALFFALAESSQHSLDVLYVDDPTQNLDHTRKRAMAKVVADLASRKQIIVSTHDEDFVTLLRDLGFDDFGVVHNIAAWNRKPEVKTTMPAHT